MLLYFVHYDIIELDIVCEVDLCNELFTRSYNIAYCIVMRRYDGASGRPGYGTTPGCPEVTHSESLFLSVHWSFQERSVYCIMINRLFS